VKFFKVLRVGGSEKVNKNKVLEPAQLQVYNVKNRDFAILETLQICNEKRR
jgi:hypothetical protein